MAATTKTYSLRLSGEAIQALQSIAMVEGVSAADLGRLAIDEFIARRAADIVQKLAEENERRQQAVDQILSYSASEGTNG